MAMPFRQMDLETEAEIRRAERPGVTDAQRLMQTFDREQHWRSRGEPAIREEMERALARRFADRRRPRAVA
jgi:hypothetical protein